MKKRRLKIGIILAICIVLYTGMILSMTSDQRRLEKDKKYLTQYVIEHEDELNDYANNYDAIEKLNGYQIQGIREEYKEFDVYAAWSEEYQSYAIFFGHNYRFTKATGVGIVYSPDDNSAVPEEIYTYTEEEAKAFDDPWTWTDNKITCGKICDYWYWYVYTTY